MANQRDIKRRISSVVNTQKITRAMKLVAAAKFARASHAVNASRPYSEAFHAMVAQLVASLSSSQVESSLLTPNETAQTSLLVMIGTDRGLCGGLNANLCKFARGWLDTQKPKGAYRVAAWGRKMHTWALKQKETIADSKEKILDSINYESASQLASELTGLYASGQYGRIDLAFNQFNSALSQTPKIIKLLPVSLEDTGELKAQDFLVEPSLDQMLDPLLERHIAIQIFQALLDSAASEHGSRMTAMDSATNNATEVKKKLTLQYNRARQAAITKELIEIISGAEAL